MQATITINVNVDGEILTETKQAAGMPDRERKAKSEAGIACDEENVLTEEEQFIVISDLANVYEYLEESEIIKIKLITQKAKARKEREDK